MSQGKTPETPCNQGLLYTAAHPSAKPRRGLKQPTTESRLEEYGGLIKLMTLVGALLQPRPRA
eukprot:3284105-Pyramimonas_sp.AAC.1